MDCAGHVRRSPHKERIVVFAVLAAMALAVIDAGIVNVALPSLALAFDAAPSHVILVVTAYQVALLIGLLPSAHIAERVGYRTLFVGGIALFCGTALLCANAPTLWLLITARFLQGLGGAAIMALGVALMRIALGDERLGAAIAWNALTVATCSAAGPAVGALILLFAPWRWLFIAALPLGAIALVAARALPDDTPTRKHIDRSGIAMYAATVLLFLSGAKTAGTYAGAAWGFAAAAVACLLWLASRSRKQEAPLVPFDLLERQPFALQIGAATCLFIGQSIGLVALPFYVQAVLGRGPLVVGLVVTCWPLAVAIASMTANRMKRRPGTAAQCVLGSVVLAAGLLLSATVTPQSDVVRLAIGAGLCGVGFGLFQLANNKALFFSAPISRAAITGGMQGTARLAGQVTGTVIVSLIFSSWALDLAPRFALFTGAGFALAAALISAWAGRLPRPDASSNGYVSCDLGRKTILVVSDKISPR